MFYAMGRSDGGDSPGPPGRIAMRIGGGGGGGDHELGRCSNGGGNSSSLCLDGGE